MVIYACKQSGTAVGGDAEKCWCLFMSLSAGADVGQEDGKDKEAGLLALTDLPLKPDG